MGNRALLLAGASLEKLSHLQASAFSLLTRTTDEGPQRAFKRHLTRCREL